MKELAIEWKHYDKDGATCDRCSNTGVTLSKVIKEIVEEFNSESVRIDFTETLLPEDAMAQSNLILFNGVPLEAVLEDTHTSENACESCSCLTGKDTSCRTVEHEGVSYEDIPAELIRKAVLKSLQLA